MNKAETILITGGGGYIGVVLVEELLKHGYKVKVLDTFYWGREPLKHIKDKVELIQADIRDVGSDVLKNVQHVIHAAALSNDPMANFNPKANFEINTKATTRFAKLCKQSNIKRFIFASSASIYDKGLVANNEIQDEESPVSPKAAYSVSKYKVEKEILKLTGRSFCPVIFRQGTVFGFSPRMRYDLVVNTMVKDAISSGKIFVYCNGQEWRPLVEIRDVAKAYVLLLEASEEVIKGQLFNLVYKNYNILSLARIIKEVLKKVRIAESKIIVDNSKRKARSYKISGNKLKKLLGWSPQISVEESVMYTVRKIFEGDFVQFQHPRFYNIEWMKLLTEVAQILKISKRVF